jgi:hypothetical protein
MQTPTFSTTSQIRSAERCGFGFTVAFRLFTTNAAWPETAGACLSAALLADFFNAPPLFSPWQQKARRTEQRHQSSYPSMPTQPIADALGTAVAQNSFGPGFLLRRQRAVGNLPF